MNSIVISTLDKLYQMPNPREGQLYFCNEDEKYYIYNNEWSVIDPSMDLGLNLYELNKSVVSQLPPMTMAEISDKMTLIEDYYDKSSNNFHMLLCREFNYYTIFSNDSMISFPTFSGAVCSIITELGKVYSIELQEDGAMEIWIQPEGTETPLAFYLFPYDAGVVYYG